MKTKVKHCMLCRGDSVFEHYYPFDGYQNESPIYRIRCEKCGLTVQTSKLGNIPEMIKRWNFCSDLTETVDIETLL